MREKSASVVGGATTTGSVTGGVGDIDRGVSDVISPGGADTWVCGSNDDIRLVSGLSVGGVDDACASVVGVEGSKISETDWVWSTIGGVSVVSKIDESTGVCDSMMIGLVIDHTCIRGSTSTETPATGGTPSTVNVRSDVGVSIPITVTDSLHRIGVLIPTHTWDEVFGVVWSAQLPILSENIISPQISKDTVSVVWVPCGEIWIGFDQAWGTHGSVAGIIVGLPYWTGLIWIQAFGIDGEVLHWAPHRGDHPTGVPPVVAVWPHPPEEAHPDWTAGGISLRFIFPVLISIGVFLSRNRLSKSHMRKNYERIQSSRLRKKLQNIEFFFYENIFYSTKWENRYTWRVESWKLSVLESLNFRTFSIQTHYLLPRLPTTLCTFSSNFSSLQELSIRLPSMVI